MIGLGSIPILSMNVIDVEKFLSFIPQNLQFTYLLNLDKKSLLLFASIIVASIFLIKNILLSIFIYFQGSIIKDIKIDLSERLIKIYLNSNYSFFFKKKSFYNYTSLNNGCWTYGYIYSKSY